MKNEKSVRGICKNCEWWGKLSADQKVNQGIEEGACKRYPPQLMASEDGVACVSPVTEWNDFCGDFRRRLDA